MVDKNSDMTEMTIDYLLGLFSLVLHPQAAFATLRDLENVKTITRELYRLNFGAIPQAGQRRLGIDSQRSSARTLMLS
ncbi:hypothetical protein FGO68_gene10177 [Halteria grandinella]|uniref:Uncharacterized protein n=1 Tax=Halteria grandinella TaxID=5974 RepID=A0A8J8N9Y3_HALGN|nr:hypothetical protein FGO68_gene10177 [Halteria grandinella]